MTDWRPWCPRKSQIWDIGYWAKTNKIQLMREKHGVLPSFNCKRNCMSKFSDEQRDKIMLNFGSWTGMKGNCLLLTVCDIIGWVDVPVHASHSDLWLHYFLHNGVESVVVCKVFYLTTLGYPRSNDFFVYHALKSVVSGILLVSHQNRNACRQQNRPCNDYEPHSRITRLSHYRWQHAPNRHYLHFYYVSCRHISQQNSEILFHA